MGQNISSEGEIPGKEEIDEIVDELRTPHHAKHANHDLFISNGDLESAGDLDSILQAMNVATPTPESEGNLNYI